MTKRQGRDNFSEGDTRNFGKMIRQAKARLRTNELPKWDSKLPATGANRRALEDHLGETDAKRRSRRQSATRRANYRKSHQEEPMKFVTETKLYRIARQPSNQHVPLVGGIGYLKEIQGDYANIQTLHEDGRTSGWGTVPLSCLEEVNDPKWDEARNKHTARIEALRLEGQARTAARNKLVSEVAEKYGVKPEVAEAIYQELDPERS